MVPQVALLQDQQQPPSPQTTSDVIGRKRQRHTGTPTVAAANDEKEACLRTNRMHPRCAGRVFHHWLVVVVTSLLLVSSDHASTTVWAVTPTTSSSWFSSATASLRSSATKGATSSGSITSTLRQQQYSWWGRTLEEDENKDNEQDNNQEQDENMEMEQDDFFEDAIADDVVSDNNIDDSRSKQYYDDDFYKFDGDPYPTSLFPIRHRYIVGYVIAFLGLMLGASGGIGGGGIAVPVYLLVSGLSPKAAMAVGSVTILGGTLASTYVNISRRHPLADRPLIDWDLVLVMQPVVLIGVFLGTFFHQILSDHVLVVMLVILLSITARTTLGKAIRMFQAENRYIRHLKTNTTDTDGGGSPSRSYTWGSAASEESPKHGLHLPESPQEKWMKDSEKERILIENPDFITMRSDLLEQDKLTPTSKIAILGVIISILTVMNVFIGGGGYSSPLGIECGSSSFWMMHVVMIGFLIVTTWAAQTYLIARHEIKNMVRFNYVQGDIRWNKSAGWMYPVFFLFAGLFAGMFGIGGGIVIVPLLLHLGTHPMVASSTSSAMVFMTSLVSSSTYFVFGLILTDFAIVGFFVGLVASYIGQQLMARARQARSASGRKFERNSYIAFVIGGIVMCSAILMTIQYVLSIRQGDRKELVKFCDVRF